MRFTGRGHPAVRATHGKTLELVTGPEVTERGTCVVAVSAEAEPAAPLAGPVRIRITAGTERHTLDAVANPAWEPGGAVVVRRGPLRLPGTFATDASIGAAGLPRPLVAGLQDPDTLVTVDVTATRAPAGSDHTLVLVAADPEAATASPPLRAELDRADEVIAEDAVARRLAGPDRGAPGGRTVIVAALDLPGASCPSRLTDAVLDTVGLPPRQAVAAACPSRAPLTFAADSGASGALARVPATHRLVLTLRRSDLPDLLRLAAEVRGHDAATVMQPHGRPLRASSADVPDLSGAEQVACCLHPAPAADALDPAVRAALDALLADGVPTRTAAKALAALTGWERRRAYAAVLAWHS